MKFIVDFYQNLDTLNLILFWGVILVIILLLTFSIIIAKKNSKLKDMLNSKMTNSNEESDIIPISTEIIAPENNSFVEQQEEISTPIEVEKNFVAEEHVIEYINNQTNENIQDKKEIEISNNTIKEKNENIQNSSENISNNKIEPITIPNKPYQKNVLREMSLNQTSPIGIVKPENNHDNIIKKANELHQSLSQEEKIDTTNQNQIEIEKKSPIEKTQNKTTSSKEQYLEEVSDKLSKASNITDIERTEYELKQEEEAIISYEELMQKKDSIQMVDEEEAVISIEELMQKKIQDSKLYNLTEEEENDKFISELKHFRNDL